MQIAKKVLRVGILGIYHESNTLIDRLTVLQDFENSHRLTGNSICNEYIDGFHEISGMLEVLNHNRVEVVPGVFSEATPGGPVSLETFDLLLNEMMDTVDKILPLNGLLVAVHGAAVSEASLDMDGYWLSKLREKVGDLPIIGTLDPHANASQLMINSTDALVSYKTNPHVDQRDTGKEAANLLLDLLNNKTKPTQTLVQTPVAISIERQNSSVEPCRSLYDRADPLLGSEGLLSISILFGFPYADVVEMGTSFIVVSDNDESRAEYAGQVLKDHLIKNHKDYVGHAISLPVQMRSISSLPKPVLLLDMGDNVGGGTAGSSTFLLEHPETENKHKTFICICDTKAVEVCDSHIPGDKFLLSFGENPVHSEQYTSQITFLASYDGEFKEDLPRHGGQLNYNMGRVAIIITEKGNTVMLHSLRIAPFSVKQLTEFGINPSDFHVVVAKGVNAPLAAYGPFCPSTIQIHSPGLTRADMTSFFYKNRRKAMFPFEAL